MCYFKRRYNRALLKRRFFISVQKISKYNVSTSSKMEDNFFLHMHAKPPFVHRLQTAKVTSFRRST